MTCTQWLSLSALSIPIDVRILSLRMPCLLTLSLFPFFSLSCLSNRSTSHWHLLAFTSFLPSAHWQSTSLTSLYLPFPLPKSIELQPPLQPSPSFPSPTLNPLGPGKPQFSSHSPFLSFLLSTHNSPCTHLMLKVEFMFVSSQGLELNMVLGLEF